MKTLYIDCGMGASGDMLLGALYALDSDPVGALAALNALDPHIHFDMQEGESGGLWGLRARVLVAGGEEEGEETPLHGHAHGHVHAMTLAHVYAHIDALNTDELIKTQAKEVYALLAAAEAQAHGTAVDSVHFHEVGMLDAIADITGSCLLMHRLRPEKIVASPVHVGSGTVQCAHGMLPVPAPAVANLLCGIPSYGGSIDGELCTPTGAALLKYFVTAFNAQPIMRVERIGIGLGKRQFDRPNALRAFWGETERADNEPNDVGVELSCNLDDMTGEQMGFALERLMESGARDVCYLPIVMKKGRPAYRLLCQCAPENADALAAKILRYTSSFGVQRTDTRRYILERRITTKETPYGDIHVKMGTGYGAGKAKPEYEDAAKTARSRDVCLADALCAHNEESIQK